MERPRNALGAPKRGFSESLSGALRGGLGRGLPRVKKAMKTLGFVVEFKSQWDTP